jgi:RNA polymerase nonessential primary-like sigma factor
MKIIENSESSNNNKLLGDLNIYMNQATRSELLSRQQEIQYFEDYSNVRINYYKAILNSDFVISNILEVLNRVSLRELPYDRFIAQKTNYLDSYKTPISKANTLCMMNENLKTIQRILIKNQELFKICINKNSSREEKNNAYNEILKGREKASILILELRPSKKVMLNAYNALLDFHSANTRSPESLDRKMELFQYAKHTLSSPRMTQSYIQSCVKLERDLSNIQDRIVLANTRLVISIVRKFINNNDLDAIDMISEGNLGLIKAIDKFSLAKGSKFSTYATWWVRQSIYRALNSQSDTITKPDYVCHELRKLRKAIGLYYSRHGVNPSNEILAEITKISEESVKHLLPHSSNILSLDEPSRKESSTLGENLSQTNEPLFELLNEHDFESLRAEILKMLDRLNNRERQVIKLRYGLNKNRETCTLEEVGRILKVTRESKTNRRKSHEETEINLFIWKS